MKSNSEQGAACQWHAFSTNRSSAETKGRADIVVKERHHRRAIVIEAKWSGKGFDLETECEGALKQIQERQYTRQLQTEGFETILCYGAAFHGKECLVKLAGNK